MPIITLSSHVALGWRSSQISGIDVVPIQVVCSSLAAFSLLALLYEGVAKPLCTWGSAQSVTAKIKEREGRKKKQRTEETQF